MADEQQDDGGGFFGGIWNFLSSLIMPLLLLIGGFFLFKHFSDGDKEGGGLGGMFNQAKEGISSFFGGKKTPEQEMTTQPQIQPQSQILPTQAQILTTQAPLAKDATTKASPSQAALKAMSEPLSYATKDNNTAWLNPADYHVTIPEHVIAEAKARGDKGVYAMVAIKAGQHKDGHAYVSGLQIIHDIATGKQTVIPTMSGGSKDIGSVDFSNPDAVESTSNAPLAGLVKDSTVKGDGIHTARKIIKYDDTAATVKIDGKDRNFMIFMELESGKTNRSDIGVHNDFLDDGEKKDAPWGSRGCPVIRESDIALFKKEVARLGIGTGSTYYILDRVETVKDARQPLNVSQAASVTTQSLPKVLPPITNSVSP